MVSTGLEYSELDCLEKKKKKLQAEIEGIDCKIGELKNKPKYSLCDDVGEVILWKVIEQGDLEEVGLFKDRSLALDFINYLNREEEIRNIFEFIKDREKRGEIMCDGNVYHAVKMEFGTNQQNMDRIISDMKSRGWICEPRKNMIKVL